MSEKFIDDPRKVVKAGDIVKVKVMEIDIERKRIGLSMRLDDQPGQEAPGKAQPRPARAGKPNPSNKSKRPNQNRQPSKDNLMAARLAQAFNRK
jgi:uncharacterized protein